jgi:hypothetical protein
VEQTLAADGEKTEELEEGGRIGQWEWGEAGAMEMALWKNPYIPSSPLAV